MQTSRSASQSYPKRKILHVLHYFAHGFVELPTRLLCVGGPKDPGNVLRLYRPNENDRMKYVALSHCWGIPTKEEKLKFCTTDDNIESRLRMFSLSELPKTFRDAIQVTRELGVQYLRIDSLCTI
ncbi:HET-domain-containing protein [Cenococcum geophilum 1.58]|uniref:HET-domain-containing protein n=1 Tax=Cenococcum geophilum 1.58 TaxID=794803 RepID=UPI00358F81D6|nr:HET-domain-containing protein [Cenococcum geophilum 1.58]